MAEPIKYKATGWVGQPISLQAHMELKAADMVAADVTSIAYTITKAGDASAVSGPTALSPVSTYVHVLRTTNPPWTADDDGHNFSFDLPAQSSAGVYHVLVDFVMAGASAPNDHIYCVFLVTLKTP